MKFRFNLLILLLSVILVQCDHTFIPEEIDSIVGVWVESTFEDDFLILVRKTKLDDNKPGIIFYEDGTLLERKNSGWCGTPPISYSNFEGSWEKIADNIYEIESTNWSGIITYKIEVVQVTEDYLKYRNIFED
ncbi:MAG: hypothetical protein JEY94_17790 [Melioribacteraceae bacterium]|nr:hypothetical protein [Melioribacteraceae bacterium]